MEFISYQNFLNNMEVKQGIPLSFGEEANSMGATLVAYIKKSPGETGTRVQQRKLIEDVISIAGIDKKTWEPKYFKITPNAWGVTMKIGYKGQEEAQQAYNFQLKVEIRFERIAPNNPDKFRRDLVRTLSSKGPKVKKREYHVKNGALFMPDLPDQHFGRYSYAKEVGDSFDLQVAAKRSNDAFLGYFIPEAEYLHKQHPIEKILIPVGNDIFNYDYAKPVPHTSNDTPQESDSRYQKMFFTVAKTVIDQIEGSAELAPVEVLIIPGNHDEQTAFYLGMMLMAWFKNHENITVDWSPRLRKYKEWGVNMLGFSHGQYESFERLFANMAFEEQEMWGRTLYKYMYTGHMHHKEVKEKVVQVIKEIKIPKNPTLITEDLNGVMFDRLASLTSNDYYETSRGYLHLKQAEAFLFDKELGKTHSLVYQLPLSTKPDNR